MLGHDIRRIASVAARMALSVAALSMSLSVIADVPDFRVRPLLAGKASLTGPGFVVRREVGVASFAPELRLPVELVYDSSCAEAGAFGFAWRCPQLESSVRWGRDGLTWTAPWGETVRFRPGGGGKAAMGSSAVGPAAAAKGRRLAAPYTDWEAEAASVDFAECRRFTVTGRNGMRGWRFAYEDGRLASVSTPFGAVAEFARGADGELLAVTAGGVRLIGLKYDGGTVSSMEVGGVRISFAYGRADYVALPGTADGLARTLDVRVLSSVRVASLEPEAFAYRGGYLASASRGAFREAFAVQTETPAERRRNLLSADRSSGVAHTGKVAGRLMSDADCAYSYPTKTSVRLADALGGVATHDFDAMSGTHRVADFSGETRTTYFFMRHDAAYLGKVRKVVDGRGRDVVSFRYDRETARPVRVTDRLGVRRILEYDAQGNCVRLSRRAGVMSASEPVRSFSYDRAGRLSSVSELDADGRAARTVDVAYGRSGRPVRASDGRRTVTVAYAENGFPAKVGDGFSSVSLSYDRFNRLAAVADASGVVTRRTYADHGGLAKVERLDGGDVLSSLAVAYDGCGRPVSVTDQDGRVTACSRDGLGRIVRERYADGSEAAYGYDALGRLARVVDEEGHGIAFGWDRFGLSSSLTAAGQLTAAKRGADGLVAEVESSVTGRVDRAVRIGRDGFGRVAKADWGNGETETFAYDRWGRLSGRTRGRLRETYRYDHFGRLVEKDGNGTVFTYAYDAWGGRTSMKVRLADGTETEERRTYDRHGRLAEISAFGTSVRCRYDAKGRIARQTVDGTPVDFAYDRFGRLAGKWMGGRDSPIASVVYGYARDGRIVSRTANGVRQEFSYDGRGRLVAVAEDGAEVERYAYDRAGNMVRRTVRGRTTTFKFDGANQLVGSTVDGVETRYAYDAAGRLVSEGGKAYRYGYLDKVLSMTDGKRTHSYAYHADGQLARADYGDGRSEGFLWDGLALVRRGGEGFVNEPHPGGGSPILSSQGKAYLADALGTTVAVRDGARGRRRVSTAALTAFGDSLPNGEGADPASEPFAVPSSFFTGKPHVAGLGWAFLFRSYRADLARWQTADPLGYPDGWNRFAYCNGWVISCADSMGGHIIGTMSYILDIGGFYEDNYLYYAIRLQCQCNHNYDNPVLRPFFIGGAFFGFDKSEVVFDKYDEILGVSYEVSISVNRGLSNSRQIIHDTATGREVEIWANVILEMTATNSLTDEIYTMASMEYKDMHFYCFIPDEKYE